MAGGSFNGKGNFKGNNTEAQRYFARYVLVTDNGFPFATAEFVSFTKNCSIKHIVIPPGHPATNCPAKSFMGITNKALETIYRHETSEREEIEQELLTYRNWGVTDLLSLKLYIHLHIRELRDWEDNLQINKTEGWLPIPCQPSATVHLNAGVEARANDVQLLPRHVL
ncbi:K02A2.6-like [Cordylochernes scorpioides]|uniref:K02A2.6-like n=1 Tax=Cordylochernes scorpioides TaxID=51811 RepID=A0ABY6LVS5_9ARAC|nr:K02A2.6-like [Cordylochernes scorpioides]